MSGSTWRCKECRTPLGQVRGDDGSLELTGVNVVLERRGGVGWVTCPNCGEAREWVPYATLAGRVGRS